MDGRCRQWIKKQYRFPGKSLDMRGKPFFIVSAVGFRKKKKSLFLRPMGGCQGIANRVALSSPILMQSGFSRPSSPDRNAAAFLSLTLYVGSTQKKWKWRMDGWWTLNGTGRDGPHAAPEGGKSDDDDAFADANGRQSLFLPQTLLRM